jgi:hypothetical protein
MQVKAGRDSTERTRARGEMAVDLCVGSSGTWAVNRDRSRRRSKARNISRVAAAATCQRSPATYPVAGSQLVAVQDGISPNGKRRISNGGVWPLRSVSLELQKEPVCQWVKRFHRGKWWDRAEFSPGRSLSPPWMWARGPQAQRPVQISLSPTAHAKVALF